MFTTHHVSVQGSCNQVPWLHKVETITCKGTIFSQLLFSVVQAVLVVDPVLLCQEKLTTFLGSCNFFFSVKKLPDVMTIII